MIIIELDFYRKIQTPEELPHICQQVLEQIQSSSQDTTFIIDLSCNPLNEDIAALEPILLHPQVTEVRLDDDQLTGVGVVNLCSSLSRRTAPLNALSLSNNNLGLDGALAIAQLLRNTALQSLNIANCQLPQEGILQIAQALANNLFLRHLNLNSNAINEGISYIVQMMLTNNTLEKLELCQCELDAEKTKSLGNALRYNTKLNALNIDSNPLTQDTILAIIQELSFNKTLTEYYGPDVNMMIAGICTRNKLIPCNICWSGEYNPEASEKEKSTGLIKITAATPESSLLYLAARRALIQNQLNVVALGETILENVIETATQEACITPFRVVMNPKKLNSQ